MFAGVLGAGFLFASFQRLYDSTPRGTFTLPMAVHLPPGLVVFGVVLMGIGAFWTIARHEATRI
jgi:hypothetical protein